ncbi:MAG: VOC family protein [Cyanobacteria bacterium REEB65]|nr:VOC family protein [Cyanobacteria bacterium REEB65]
MRFLHTRLKVRDLERSIAFYCQQLGCTLTERKVSGRGTQLAFLALPGARAHLELAYLPWDPDFRLDDDIFHLAFEVPNLDQAIATLRAAGIPITEEASRSSSGSLLAFIADPDGYEIELLQHAGS